MSRRSDAGKAARSCHSSPTGRAYPTYSTRWSGELYPLTPDYFGLTASDVAFDPDAPDPQHWLAFLGDLFETDVQAIATLQDWFGYAPSPDTSQHKILFIVGPRRSGKGTIARVLTAARWRGVLISA